MKKTLLSLVLLTGVFVANAMDKASTKRGPARKVGRMRVPQVNGNRRHTLNIRAQQDALNGVPAQDVFGHEQRVETTPTRLEKMVAALPFVSPAARVAFTSQTCRGKGDNRWNTGAASFHHSNRRPAGQRTHSVKDHK